MQGKDFQIVQSGQGVLLHALQVVVADNAEERAGREYLQFRKPFFPTLQNIVSDLQCRQFAQVGKGVVGQNRNVVVTQVTARRNRESH